MLPSVQNNDSRSLPLTPALYRLQQSQTTQSYPTPHIEMGSEIQRSTIYPNPCIVSPPVDPSAVDFRAFFPYTPNEVKHRKRTTSAQLKVLESIFKRDTKPNATLRKELASQLDMTARGVQVWFQNRRAKEKNKANKTVNSKNLVTDPVKSTGHPQESPTSPRSSEETGQVPESPPESQSYPSPDPVESGGEASSQASSPVDIKPFFRLSTTSSNTSWQGSPVEPPASVTFLHQSSEMTDAHLANLRRGSLPVNVFPPAHRSPQSPPVIDQLDPLARRRSVDASLQRLAYNPYAPLARAKNGVLFGSRMMIAPSQPPVYQNHSGRPGPPHQMNLLSQLEGRRASIDLNGLASGVPMSPSPPPLSSYNGLKPPGHLYAFSSRPMASPIPGPLPSPGYSFGAPTSPSLPSHDGDRRSPDSFHQFAFRGDELDTEDDSTSTSYEGFSRFGSVTSIATSESSVLYPEAGSCKPENELAGCKADVRRDSCASFLDMMSGLDVNQVSTSNHNPDTSVNYGNQDELALAGASNGMTNNSGPCSYPSPSSTASPGGSPPIVPISRSSELAYALQCRPEQMPDPVQGGPKPITSTTPLTCQSEPDLSHSSGYPYKQESAYMQSAGSSSSINLPIQFAEKYTYEPDEFGVISASGHYQPPFRTAIGNQYSMNEGHTSLTSQEELSVPQTVDYSQCASSADNFSLFNDGTSSIQNALHGVDSYVTYS